MNSDDLGELGADAFRTWCTHAGLICNPSTRDRAGWDFLVDFPHAPSLHSLDRRPGPQSCVVQLKTVLETSDNIRIRLDMLERLAKDVKPCFIITPVVRGLEVVNVRVWHLRGEHLERVLRRLRQEQAKGLTAETGKKHITFRLDTGEPMAPSGAALRTMFEAACPKGMQAYASGKGAEVATLGMGEVPYQVSFSIDAQSPLDLLDFFIGDAKNAPGEISALMEDRLGVKLPMAGTMAGRGELSLEPAPVGDAVIRIISPSLTLPLVDRAAIITVPFEIEGHRRLRVRGRYLSVTVTWFPDGMADVEIAPIPPSDTWTLRDWASHVIARGLASLESAVMEIDRDDVPEALVSLPLLSSERSQDRRKALSKHISAVRRLENLAAQAGMDLERTLTAEDIDRASEPVLALDALESGNLVSFEATEPVEEFNDATVVVVGLVPLGQISLAWHGLMRVSATALQPVMRFRLDDFRFVGVHRLRNGGTLAGHVDRLRETLAVEGAIWVGWDRSLIAGSFEGVPLPESVEPTSQPRDVDRPGAG
ncbi:hypothetical protein [Luteibacter sp. CQ10]|uniref:hypothetical protein n=1 Tax=Luteibacter sp. CQ10 TaxID=2805821 RepID=UPI0034A181F0